MRHSNQTRTIYEEEKIETRPIQLTNSLAKREKKGSGRRAEILRPFSKLCWIEPCVGRNFLEKKKRDTLHACPPLSLSLFLSLSILSLRLSRLIGSKMEEKRKEGIRRDDAPLSFSLSIYLLSSIVEIDRFENSSKKREKKEEGGIRRDDALSLSLSLSLCFSLSLSVCLSISFSVFIYLSVSVCLFLSLRLFFFFDRGD